MNSSSSPRRRLLAEQLESRLVFSVDLLGHVEVGPDISSINELSVEVDNTIRSQDPPTAKGSSPQNRANPIDVTSDGFVSGQDALVVINRINQEGGGQVDDSYFADVNVVNQLGDEVPEGYYYWLGGNRRINLGNPIDDHVLTLQDVELPVFRNPENGLRRSLTDSVIVDLKDTEGLEWRTVNGQSQLVGTIPPALAEILGDPRVIGYSQSGGEILITVTLTDGFDALRFSNDLHGNPAVRWAEPNFYQEFHRWPGPTPDPEPINVPAVFPAPEVDNEASAGPVIDESQISSRPPLASWVQASTATTDVEQDVFKYRLGALHVVNPQDQSTSTASHDQYFADLKDDEQVLLMDVLLIADELEDDARVN